MLQIKLNSNCFYSRGYLLLFTKTKSREPVYLKGGQADPLYELLQIIIKC
jgi:hypothetical protein